MFFRGKILTVKEIADLLKVNKRTVYRWIDSGDLKYARLGRKTYRIFEYDLKKFINKNIN